MYIKEQSQFNVSVLLFIFFKKYVKYVEIC